VTRPALEVGGGLAASRVARPIRPGERIHVVGIAGAGASGAALLAAGAGASVSGCDSGGPSPYAVAVEAAGIPVDWRHDPGHVITAPFPDRLAVTKALTAVDPDNPELAAARAAGVPLESWQQVVADAAAGRSLVAVAGTHGKSTSAGWLVHVLASAGMDPGAFVGALMPASVTGALRATARLGRGPVFVVEADEYAGNFDPYHPALVILGNVDWDHPDVFADQAAVSAAFERWLRRAIQQVGRTTLVANIGDPGVADLLGRLGDWPGELITVALADEDAVAAPAIAATIRGRITHADPQGTMLEISGAARFGLDRPLCVRLPTAGRHNAANALGVAAAALALGVGRPVLAAALETFPGVGRRLERLGEAAGVVVYDDYGHHPTAIRETVRAVRQREPVRRIWAVYEPLTYHRTAALLDAFADALGAADGVVIAAIWPGRDTDTTVASATGLAAAVVARWPNLAVVAPGTIEETAAWLGQNVRVGDAVLVMGGGQSYRIGPLLLRTLAER